MLPEHSLKDCVIFHTLEEFLRQCTAEVAKLFCEVMHMHELCVVGLCSQFC